MKDTCHLYTDLAWLWPMWDDAISYMNCRKDFEAAFRTTWAPLNSGGVLVVTPDVMSETFQQDKTTVTP